MKLFIAGTNSNSKLVLDNPPKYVLESFYYIKEWQLQLIKKCDMFLLDSGAFTFMNSTKKQVDWKSYIDKYIKFIDENDIKYFFELDIDVVVGYENVKKIREYIEEKTGKQCIPVWHKSRGKEEFIKMCQEYKYAAIGGIVTKEIKPDEYKYFEWFIKTANRYGCKIHGLGLTSKHIETYGFYSVDSTTWTQAARFGELSIFDGKKMVRITNKSSRGKPGILELNYKQWLKYQKYLERF